MKLNTFLTINAFMIVPYGLGMLTLPSLIFPLVGVHLDADGLVMASTVELMLLSFGLICFLRRNESLTSIGMLAILTGNLVFQSLDSFLTGKGAITEVMNPMDFIFSGMRFIFAIGFLYFLIKARKPKTFLS